MRGGDRDSLKQPELHRLATTDGRGLRIGPWLFGDGISPEVADTYLAALEARIRRLVGRGLKDFAGCAVGRSTCVDSAARTKRRGT